MSSRSWRTWANSTTPSSSSPPTTAPRRSASPTAASRRSRVRRARPGKAATASAGRPLAGPHQAGHDQERDLRRRSTGCRRLVDIAGGPKGDGLKKQIEAGKYPGIVKTTLDGFDQRDYLEGKSDKSARDVFFYYSGSTPSAVRYKNWKMYYTMSQPRARPAGSAARTYHWTLVENIKRDPFEQARRREAENRHWRWAVRWRRPSPPIIYDWNMLPIGQHALAEGTGVATGVPAAAGPGDLQPRRRCWRSKSSRPRERLTAARVWISAAGVPEGRGAAISRSKANRSRNLRTLQGAALVPLRENSRGRRRHRTVRGYGDYHLPWPSLPGCPPHAALALPAFAASLGAARPISAAARCHAARSAVVERRPGETGDPRFRHAPPPTRRARISCRRRSASRPSTRTARCGSSIRSTRKSSIAWTACRRW